MVCHKYIQIVAFLCYCSLGCGDDNVLERNRENTAKQHPELSNLVKNWATKLGGELWHFGDLVTRQNRVRDSFKETNLVVEDGEVLLQNIHENISHMMKQKVDAVRRIMDQAEQIAQAQKETDIDFNFSFYNAKNLTNSLDNITEETSTKEPEAEEPQDDSFLSNRYQEQPYHQSLLQQEEIEGYQKDEDSESSEDPLSKDEELFDSDFEITDGTEKGPQAILNKTPIDKSKLPLIRNRNFYDIPVNMNVSAVHVPSNVYERSKEVIAGIKWSEELDKTFRSNYEIDPTLSWQYFGSSTGFMRQYPAMIWSQEPIDLFDCRTRSWYIEAASSPKDIVILVDRSGSMTGMRREIARHVVHNILDTLGNNDYVNIYTFSNTTDSLVECFDGQLVQANLANVRVLKESMSDFKTEQIANFSSALITAFELLQDYRINKKGARCNQAIMLITDGVQYNYKEIFEKYNWENLPFMNVRVFTYLIGREVSDVREVKWMACANQGYYVHLSTYAEVREEVLNYIPVMARPMVLNPTQKPNPTWSPVYADVTDPKLTNWLWINRERNRQRERFMGYRKLKHMLSSGHLDRTFVHQQKIHQDNYGDTQIYHLMTSVSLPVYDKKPRQERVANLLGVAGTDIPIEYIQRLMLPYRLGVNGYAFIVTNNGYILTHPDLRPVYQGILKPAYNRVDMIEIEILDDESEPRNFSDKIREFRRQVVMQYSGNITLDVKGHLDDMRRITFMKRDYYFRGINGTPFSLVISLPKKYGYTRVEPKVENDIHRLTLSQPSDKKPLLRYFTGNWTIHPDWHYCRYLDNRKHFDNPEEELLHFLQIMEKHAWKWSKESECDRKLVCHVVSDAKLTEWFNDNITTTSREENGYGGKDYYEFKEILDFFELCKCCKCSCNNSFACRAELVKKIGIVIAFMATHSGLTRWQNFPQNIETPEQEPNFEILHNKATDEIWYKRAVEHHYVDPQDFIYAVPHYTGNSSLSLVTVSKAIFREDGSKKAPVAVVGYQFFHGALQNLFTQITSKCGNIPCKRTCASQELHCLVLDDNGYVIVSDNPKETGFFFGKIMPDIMNQLLEEKIYKVTTMYDYQGLCAEGQEMESPATRILSPIVHIINLFNWFAGYFISLIKTVAGNQFEIFPSEHFQETHYEVMDENEYSAHNNDNNHYEEAEMPLSDKEFVQKFAIQVTKPEPCDTQMALYSLVHYSDRNISTSAYNKTMVECSRPYIVQKVSGSNMILLVVNNVCLGEPNTSIDTPDPVEVDYNMSLACYRATYNDFPRRHYMSCINRNANESEIKICGKASYISPTKIVPTLLLTILSNFFILS
ncbi:voltage-dependent calcium channel subunit alpha-2/delta-3 isoform X2 [Diorhabda carinulata]|uniref:voltage-dependent calcium channel subunit alpha-2/delta-3 isoform X2 n=1 Tax=Diorhabda carinulata TaxID=1163345 RepID=UPI0025A29229|nr:voltage-dependent calcium channel subunit alpha-2/delta-3 isoform X2 [Diorhabda carinulata]